MEKKIRKCGKKKAQMNDRVTEIRKFYNIEINNGNTETEKISVLQKYVRSFITLTLGEIEPQAGNPAFTLVRSDSADESGYRDRIHKQSYTNNLTQTILHKLN